MTTLEQEIVDLYENNDMSVADIAGELSGEIDATAIKYVLSQHSSKFQAATVEHAKRQNGGKVIDIVTETTPGAPAPALKPASSYRAEDIITDADRKEILNVMKNLMRSSDNDMVRARAAIYLYEEATGRNAKRVEKGDKMPNVKANILLINAQIQKGKILVESTMKMLENSPMLVSAPN